MKDIHIGTKIADKRKHKNITQEELATFLGVSKPAVSKWESGQCYPDITLLPSLAAYFDISIDELIGYEPQMLREDIKKLYAKLTNDFSRKPFDEVFAECEKYAKKYYSCWQLQLHIGLLYVNHAPLSGSPEKTAEIILSAQKKFEHISKECDEISLTRYAVYLQAYCCLGMNQPALAIDLLDGMEEAQISSEILLSNAYEMKGDHIKAKNLLQSAIYKNMMNIMNACPQLMLLYIDQPAKSKDCLEKSIAIGEIFELEKLQPSLYLQIYLTAAYVFVMQGNKQDALNNIEEYVRICSDPLLFPMKLHGNDFFGSLDDFFNSLEIGTQMPRSDIIVKQSMKDALLKNPAFDVLREETRFKILINKMEQI